MRGETSEQFQARMEKKASAQRYFIGLEEQAAVASVAAKRSPREQKAAVAAAQRAGSGRSTRSVADVADDAVRAGARRRQASKRSMTPPPRRDVSREPVACAGVCGRQVRPWGTTVEQWPGTVSLAGGGKCYACSNESKPRRTPPPECRGCGRTFRRANRPDGEVQHFSHGYCARCAPGRVSELCRGGCGRSVRPVGTSAEQWPDTIAAYTTGWCQSCSARRPQFYGTTWECKGGCGRMVRQNRLPRDSAPGTVPAGKDGMCRPCTLTASGERRRVNSTTPASTA